MKKPVPLGFCKDCRWAREFPPGMKLGPFEFDCQAMPWRYEPTKEEGKVKDPVTGKTMVQMGMMYLAHPHQGTDYCAFFDDRPAMGDGNGEEEGGGLL